MRPPIRLRPSGACTAIILALASVATFATAAFAVPPNDTCAGAIVIPCGNVSLSGNTFDATNNYDFPDTTLSCTGYSAGGRDVVYQLTAQAGDSLWLRYQSSADASIYLVTDCSNVTGTCVVGSDLNHQNQLEDLRYHFTQSGTYYLVVDSYGPDTYGNWTLTGQFLGCGLTLPSNDRCETASPLYCNAAFFYSGNTLTAASDYAFPSLGASCVGSLAQGRDVVFSLTVNAGDSLSATYTSSADGVMYLMPDCPQSGTTVTCVAGSNATGVGGSETMNFTFAYTGTYYLVLDSDGLGTNGSWQLQGVVICGLDTPSNDLCSSATFVPCGAFNLSGDDTHAFPDYDPGPNGCTGFPAAGTDVVYLIMASVGDSIWCDYVFPHVNGKTDVDASVYLVTDCSNMTASCVAGSDSSGAAGVEKLRYRFPATGRYYLVLDSYDSGIYGTWTATGAVICPAGVAAVGPGAPGAVALAAAAPNPFRATSVLRFTMARRERAVLRIHDLAGRVVRTMIDADLPAGSQSATWDARDDAGRTVAGGTYFARLQVGGVAVSRTVVFVR